MAGDSPSRVNGYAPDSLAVLVAPFILANSVLGLAGVLLAGQGVAPGTGLFAEAALVGAMLGTAVGQRWLSQQAVRCVLAGILFCAGARLLVR